MKNILAAAAISLMASTAAFADAHTGLMTYKMEATTDLSASTLIGMRVYSAEKDYDTYTAETVLPDDSEKEWDDIGEVNDVILGRDGMVKAVVLGVGGFIGIGEKDVALPMEAIKIVNEADDAGDFFLVVKTTKEQLEGAEGFERDVEKAMEKTGEAVSDAADATATAVATGAGAVATKTEETAEAVVTTTENAVETETTAETVVVETEKPAETMTAEPVTTEAPAAATDVRMDGDRPMLRRVEVEREGYTMAVSDELTTEDLTGMRVYGSNDEDVGEIDTLVMSDDGKISKAVIGVGGFLGIGEKSIAVTMDELNILRNADGDTRVYIDATQEGLEAQPEYEG